MASSQGVSFLHALILVGFFIHALILVRFFSLGEVVVSTYERPSPRKDIVVPPSALHDSTGTTSTPQQVHVSIVGEDRMRVSWVTKRRGSRVVDYGTSPGNYSSSATGTTSSYHYMWYKSGEIHDVVIGPLQPNTVYYYRCGGPNSTRNFTFKTPPARLPIKFAVSGDLGQTDWTKSTLDHISKSNYDVFILPGDLSYADAIQPLWDSFGRLVEPLASQRPWMVTQGNHEVEKIPVVHPEPFTAYNARWRMPFEQSGSPSNLFYSFEVAGVHVLMLGSYTDFGPDSEQYAWLKSDLEKVNRTKTPWLVCVVHAPWYNSNEAHQGEPASDDMKKAMEELLFNAKVDLVFAGHVHAYERFTRVFHGEARPDAPAYINVGDGGNREGLATKYKDPKPEISLFREASFGHGVLEVFNETHALWTWHRNDDDEAVVGDFVWLHNLWTNPR